VGGVVVHLVRPHRMAPDQSPESIENQGHRRHTYRTERDGMLHFGRGFLHQSCIDAVDSDRPFSAGWWFGKFSLALLCPSGPLLEPPRRQAFASSVVVESRLLVPPQPTVMFRPMRVGRSHPRSRWSSCPIASRTCGSVSARVRVDLVRYAIRRGWLTDGETAG
jgi:hypothetical protein